jgi:phosphatidylglycerophosphate synthase
MTPLRSLLDQAAADGRAHVLTASPGSLHWYHDVHGPADPKAAERMLLQSLKGDLEGFVDRHFNRKLSGVLTPLFLRLGLSANAVTLLSVVIGLVAAVSFSLGSYVAGVVGALLLQLTAIIDCSDGEVARLTFTESPFGDRLDIVGDNLVHAAIFGGIAWSVYLQSTGAAWPWLPLALGGAAIVANGLALWLVLWAKKLRAENAWSSPAQAARSNFILKHVASRDFSVLLLAFALLNHLDWFLWLLAIGTNVFWIVMAWMIRPSSPARA